MIIVDAVVETYDASGFTAWPVADLPAHNLLPLSGRLSSAEIGTVMAVIAGYNNLASDEDVVEPDGPEFLRRMIDAECLIAPGGLRIRDTVRDIDVNPACCFGLESWHEWLDVPHGGAPWLGHDPSPWIEHIDQTIRIWPDGGEQATPPPTGLPIEIPNTELPALLDAVHQQLRDFLGIVEPWTAVPGPSRTDKLTTALGRHLHITGTPDATWGGDKRWTSTTGGEPE